MKNIYCYIIIAFILDLIFGDPEYKLHPIRIIGYLILFFEKLFRKISKNHFINGFLFTFFIIFISTGISAILIVIGWLIDLILPFSVFIHIISIFLLYSCISVKDLKDKALRVYFDLKHNDIFSARENTGMIVGRDTHNLDEKEIVRAVVETVSENIVDGIISPVFFGIIGGPCLAVMYKSINTMDSMIGYKNEKYMLFGRSAAIIDDIVNFIPARISGILIPLVSFGLLKNGVNAFKIMIKYGNKNPSPNSGIPEAAVAGALDIKLGGINYYRGKESIKPVIGDGKNNLNIKHILETIFLAYLTGIIFLISGLFLRYFILILLNRGLIFLQNALQF